MPTPPLADSLTERLRALADDAVAGTDLFVVDVDVRGFQGSRVVSVYVDSEAGAGADDLADLSRTLGFALDTEDLVKGRYRLDVSTPGAERPLSDRRQYRRHLGRELAVTFERRADDGDQLVTAQGQLVSADDDGVLLDGEAAPIPYEHIREARVQLPW